MSLYTLRAIFSKSTFALVFTSPPIISVPWLPNTSTPARLKGSCASIASRIASDIWSHVLSGCPHVTLSTVYLCKRWNIYQPNNLPDGRLLIKVSSHSGRRKHITLSSTLLVVGAGSPLPCRNLSEGGLPLS